jgi:hypothetical protein
MWNPRVYTTGNPVLVYSKLFADQNSPKPGWNYFLNNYADNVGIFAKL